MRYIARIIVLALTYLSCAASWAAGDEPARNPAEPHFDCTADQAAPVAYRDMMANIETWVGRCVRLRILTIGYFAYADLPDLYAASGYDPRDANRKSLGLYVKREEDREKLFGYRQTVDVVALAFTCKHLHDIHRAVEASENGVGRVRVIMATGYCHYTVDPVLYVSAFTVIDPGPIRLEGQAAAEKYGNLEPLLPSHAEYAETWSRVVGWFDAVRRRDVDALTGSVGNDTKEVREELDDPKSGLRFLIGAKALPPIKFVRVKIPEPDPPDHFIAAGCICKTPDCADRWPVHSADIAYTAEWPYACIWVIRREGKYETGN